MTSEAGTFAANTLHIFIDGVFKIAGAGAPFPVKAGFWGASLVAGQGINMVINHTGSPALSSALNQINMAGAGGALLYTAATGAPLGSLLPITLVASAATLAVSSGFTELYNHNSDFRSAVDNFESHTPSFTDLIKAGGEYVADSLADMGDLVSNLPNDINQAMDAINDYLQNSYSDFADAANDIYDGAGNILDDVLSNLDNTLGDLGDALAGLGTLFGNTGGDGGMPGGGFGGGGGSFGGGGASGSWDPYSYGFGQFFNKPPVSPLIIDYNKNGQIELTPLTGDNGSFFDLDGDGFVEQTGWVQSGANPDALLARDVNGNSIIDNINELFGSSVNDGFLDLAALNNNTIGGSANAIDSLDSAWGSLRVWRDLDGDGHSDTGELLTMSQAGIKSFNLNYANIQESV